jgi:hypothetical protein
MPIFLRLFAAVAGSIALVSGPFSAVSQNTEVSVRFTLPSPAMDENSGMIRYKNRLLFINDSKNEARVFVCDTINGAPVHTCAILNAENRDWEDLAADSFFLYIGDFGNNSGMRGIYTIYRVSLECVVNQKTCKAESITFECMDQIDFSKRPRQHNFDFETLAVCGDSLLIFSKNWGNMKSRLYVLPKKPGHYRVSPRLTVNVNGLITAADYMEPEKMLVLCGYKLPPADPENFIILWKNFSLPVSTSVTFKRLAISGIPLRQTEGIVILTPGRLWVSHEGRLKKGNRVAPSVIEIRLPSP